VDVDGMSKLLWYHLRHHIFRAVAGRRKYLNFFPDFQGLESP